jgi:hypothetical protein
VLQYSSSLADLVSDQLMKDFLKSDTLFAYERLMTIMNMEDERMLMVYDNPLMMVEGAGGIPEMGHEVQVDREQQQMQGVELEKVERLKKSLKAL